MAIRPLETSQELPPRFFGTNYLDTVCNKFATATESSVDISNRGLPYTVHLVNDSEPFWGRERLAISACIAPAASTRSRISVQSPAMFPRHHALCTVARDARSIMDGHENTMSVEDDGRKGARF